MIKRALLSVLLFTSIASASAKKVSDVLGSGGGSFDPWNTTKWSEWYSGSTLIRPFEIDCNVTFVNRGGSSDPWEPTINMTDDGNDVYIFIIDDDGRGIEIDGNGQFIDNRGLFNWVGEIDRCFQFAQSNSTSKPTTIIRDIWIKGFVQAIRTTSSSSYRHPLLIQDCEFRYNNWGVYLSGSQTTVYSCGIKDGNKGGIYLGKDSHHNIVRSNNFQNNDTEEDKYYADMAVDTSHHNLIENNTHQTASGSYRVGIKFYRNMGESGDLREDYPNANIIRNNTFESGYEVAYEVGSRMGHYKNYDMSYEARDYASYNLFENNTINSATIGIKLNCSGNIIRGNTFNSVAKPIVLHCVFFSLTETTINDQAGDNVYYWFTASDYSSYSSWFPYQNEQSNGVNESEKVMHIRSDYGQPNFQSYTGAATVIKTPSLTVDSANRAPDLSGDQYINFQDISYFGGFWKRTDSSLSNNFCNGTDFNFDGSVNTIDLSKISNNWLGGNDLADVYSTGATPIDIAVGDFWVNNPGEEIAVIWDTPVSDIDGTDYYTIIIYDSNGIEINHCGRSTTKWEAIAAGNFTSLKGYEIAAVPSTMVSGKFPVYVFGRGRKDPIATLMTANTTKIVDIAAGNFNTADSYEEIAAVYTGGSTNISFCSAYAPTWTATTSGAASLTKIAGGNFSTSYSGDEIAGINASSSIIYFYRPAATTHYATAATSGLAVWDAIAGGDFNNGTSQHEAAVASSAASGGIYPVYYYSQGSTTSFKQNRQDVLGVRVKNLSAGKFAIPAKLGIYEQADGFYSTNYGSIIGTWGEHVAVLPTAAQTTAIPVFWLNKNPNNNQQEYLKVTPLFR